MRQILFYNKLQRYLSFFCFLIKILFNYHIFITSISIYETDFFTVSIILIR